MKYVLDASVAGYWVLRNPLQAKALRLRAKYRQNVHELIAPAHFPGEIASALTKAKRQKLIRIGDARRHIADVLSSRRFCTHSTRSSSEPLKSLRRCGPDSTIACTWLWPSRKTASW
jgi:predicted nucleic acid-binding protein